MKLFSRLWIGSQTIARLPEHFGINVEVQEHEDRTNLWDWLTHSGVTAVRTFHPEVGMRKQAVEADRWASIADRAAFEAMRERARRSPEQADIDWDNYRFDENIPWLGVPSRIVDRLTASDIEPMVSLGYTTRMFPRPLVKEGDHATDDRPADDEIDWPAAASAYAYYFAMIRHFGALRGVRYFMMVNEPENMNGHFYTPEAPEDFRAFWQAVFHDDDVQGAKSERYLAQLARQYGVLARLAREALEDALASPDSLVSARQATLSGPTGVAWPRLWEHAGEFLDVLDFHHYHSRPESFRTVFDAAAIHVRPGGKALAVSEFNRFSGGGSTDRSLFSVKDGLEVADMLMQVMTLSRPDDPSLAFIHFYLLHFPSTHRNYKHLLYGDMNTVDWTDQDRQMRHLGPERYPSFEQQQIRHATPAYHFFRMLARNVGLPAFESREGSKLPEQLRPRVLVAGLANPTSAGPQDFYDALRTMVVDRDDCLLINLLNPTTQRMPCVEADWSALNDAGYQSAVVRLSDRLHADEPVELHRVSGRSRLCVDVPARSFVQIILLKADLAEIDRLSVQAADDAQESKLAEGLSHLQTARLKVVGYRGAEEVPGAWLAVKWSSSLPEVLKVYSEGLLQHIGPVPGGQEVVADLVRMPGQDEQTGCAPARYPVQLKA